MNDGAGLLVDGDGGSLELLVVDCGAGRRRKTGGRPAVSTEQAGSLEAGGATGDGEASMDELELAMEETTTRKAVMVVTNDVKMTQQ